MGQVAQAAKSALANISEDSMMRLAEACASDAKDKGVGPVLAPFALQAFFRALSRRLAANPATTEAVSIAASIKPLLQTLSHSGIQDSDRFNHQIDDHLRATRHLIP
jgi:hypothetical protein